MTFRAIYENGVFKPAEPVDMPDKTQVEIQTRIISNPGESDARAEESRVETLRILSRRYNTGQTDAAARHDEHQP